MYTPVVFGMIVAILCGGSNALSVVCDSEAVTITVTAADRASMVLTRNSHTAIRSTRVTSGADYAALDAGCKIDAGTGTLTIGLHDCDHMQTTVGDQLCFQWTLWKVNTPADFDTVARLARNSIVFKCYYPQVKEVWQTFMPTIGTTEDMTSATGAFDCSIGFFFDAGCTTPIASYVLVPDRIYGKITLNLSPLGDLVVQVKKCWATPSADPTDMSLGQYMFINDFCAVKGVASDPNDVSHITQQGIDNVAKFDFLSFVYAQRLENPMMIFIHCWVQVCDTADCPAPACEKKKRSIDDKTGRIQTVSYGPIKIAPPKRTCDVDNGKCNGYCEMVDGQAVCSCPLGSVLADDGVSCIDEVRLDVAVKEQEPIASDDITKVVGLFVLFVAAVFASVLITMSCKNNKGKSPFPSV